MDRMKTFLLYALLIVGFIGLSLLLENGLISNMYKNISGTIDTEISIIGEGRSNFEIKQSTAKASNVSGFIRMSVKNTTGRNINTCYTKIDLYSRQKLLAATKYYEIKDFNNGEEKEFIINFNANEIANYKISFTEDHPGKEYIINIFGYEIDLRDIFGIDLTKYLNIDTIKDTGLSAWNWWVALVKSVPLWAYMIAGGIVLWYMPSRFLFGFFPF